MSNIGGVLYYKIRGCKEICGATVGADGSGSFIKIYYGDPDDCEKKAHNFLTKISGAYFIDYADFVSAEEGYIGSHIKEQTIENKYERYDKGEANFGR